MSLRRIKGQETLRQAEHQDTISAQITTPAVLAPGEPIDTAALTAAPGVAVVKNSLVRIKVTADTYVVFSEEDITVAPDATSDPGILLDASVNGGWHILRATEDMMRTSVAVARAENLGP